MCASSLVLFGAMRYIFLLRACGVRVPWLLLHLANVHRGVFRAAIEAKHPMETIGAFQNAEKFCFPDSDTFTVENFAAPKKT